jgi:uncharacterized protein YraI
MIEVIGPDGRKHVFAQGTTEAQIDAAMSALYPPAPPQPPPIEARQWTPPPQGAPYSAPELMAPPHRPPAQGITTPQIIIGAVVAAALTLAIVGAFMLGQNKNNLGASATTPPANGVAATNVVGGAVVVPAVPSVPGVPGTPAITPEAFSGFIATQQGGNLNVRTAPSQDAPALTKLPHGAPVSVTGSVMLADGLWRQVNVAGSIGYIKGDYISQTQPAAIAPPPAPTPLVAVGDWGTVTTVRSDTVNMRASPSLGGRVISSIPYGAEIYIISRQGDWYLVEWDGKRGWASKRFIVR